MSGTLMVTGEHTDDIQLSYGSTSWKSGTEDGEAICKLNCDDWNTDGPQDCPSMAIIVSFIDVQFPQQYCNIYANEPVCDSSWYYGTMSIEN